MEQARALTTIAGDESDTGRGYQLRGDCPMSRRWLAAIEAFRKAETLCMGRYGVASLAYARYGLGRVYARRETEERSQACFADAVAALAEMRDDPDRGLLLVQALSRLENTYNASADFRSWCEGFPRGPSPLDDLIGQWALVPGYGRGAWSEGMVIDGFDLASSEWTWQDPFDDCPCSGSDGEVELRAANVRDCGGEPECPAPSAALAQRCRRWYR